MIDSPLISVVMPAYNAEKYIKRSIEAILNQTLKQLELVVVDDCSTDGTWAIVSDFAKADRRMKIRKMKSNSGSAKYPREIAVEMADAQLICWIDSDDIVESTYIENLWNRQNETDADIVCSQMIAFQNDIDDVEYLLPHPSLRNNEGKLISGKEAVMKTIGKSWTLNANGFLVRKDLWLATSTFLDGKSCWMDADDVSTREMLLRAQKVAFANARYYYRIHSMAITKRISAKRFETLLTDACIIRLMASSFGENSVEVSVARGQYINRILSFIRLYVVNRKRLSLEDNLRAMTLIKESYATVSISDIWNSDLRGGHKWIMLMPFPMVLWIMKRINSEQ